MSKKENKVNCPRCTKETVWKGNEFRPFCSKRCKLLDLGDWATEKYSIKAEDQEAEDEEKDSLSPEKK